MKIGTYVVNKNYGVGKVVHHSTTTAKFGLNFNYENCALIAVKFYSQTKIKFLISNVLIKVNKEEIEEKYPEFLL